MNGVGIDFTGCNGEDQLRPESRQGQRFEVTRFILFDRGGIDGQLFCGLSGLESDDGPAKPDEIAFAKDLLQYRLIIDLGRILSQVIQDVVSAFESDAGLEPGNRRVSGNHEIALTWRPSNQDLLLSGGKGILIRLIQKYEPCR
jgi:hypothetical protein